MKKLIVLLGLLMAVPAYAQTTQTAPPKGSLEAQLIWELQHQKPVKATPKPDEIKGKRFGYSGIAIQLAKTDNPLQLLNPAAPAKYGSGMNNLVRNPANGRAIGWKVFSFEF